MMRSRSRQRRADFRRSSKVILALNVSVWHSVGRMFGFLNLKFGSVLDDNEAILFRNKVG